MDKIIKFKNNFDKEKFKAKTKKIAKKAVPWVIGTACTIGAGILGYNTAKRKAINLYDNALEHLENNEIGCTGRKDGTGMVAVMGKLCKNEDEYRNTVQDMYRYHGKDEEKATKFAEYTWKNYQNRFNR